MSNKVTKDKYGVIRIEYAGDQDYSTVTYVYKAVERFYRKRKAEKLLKILVNLEKVVNLNQGALVSALKALRSGIYEKIAIIGCSVICRALSGFLISAAEKEESIQFFDEEDEALRWLIGKKRITIQPALGERAQLE